MAWFSFVVRVEPGAARARRDPGRAAVLTAHGEVRPTARQLVVGEAHHARDGVDARGLQLGQLGAQVADTAPHGGLRAQRGNARVDGHVPVAVLHVDDHGVHAQLAQVPHQAAGAHAPHGERVHVDAARGTPGGAQLAWRCCWRGVATRWRLRARRWGRARRALGRLGVTLRRRGMRAWERGGQHTGCPQHAPHDATGPHSMALGASMVRPGTAPNQLMRACDPRPRAGCGRDPCARRRR